MHGYSERQIRFSKYPLRLSRYYTDILLSGHTDIIYVKAGGITMYFNMWCYRGCEILTFRKGRRCVKSAVIHKYYLPSCRQSSLFDCRFKLLHFYYKMFLQHVQTHPLRQTFP